MGKNCSIRAQNKLTEAQQFSYDCSCLLNTMCCVNKLQLLSKIDLLYRLCVMIFPGIRFLRLAAKPLKTDQASSQPCQYQEGTGEQTQQCCHMPPEQQISPQDMREEPVFTARSHAKLSLACYGGSHRHRYVRQRQRYQALEETGFVLRPFIPGKQY